MTVKGRKGPEEFKVDEHPKPDSTIEQLAKLAPVFKKDGTITAANASVRILLLLFCICVFVFCYWNANDCPHQAALRFLLIIKL